MRCVNLKRKGHQMNPRILAVDDDDLILDAMKMALTGSRFQLDTAKSADECLQLVRQHPLRYAVVFIDYNLTVQPGRPEQRGDFVAKRIKDINSDITVVMVSGDKSEHAFKAWIAAEVDQFLYKPFETHQVLALAENGCSRFEVDLLIGQNDGTNLNDISTKDALRSCQLISHSPALGRTAKLAMLVAKNNLNVLILGETGTGKEMIAKAIHSQSELRKKPYLPINCSSYANSENLLESELFGHEKGSFTGADKLKIGIFEAAQGGVVFLDEIHHLGPIAQKKLLRVIEERKVRRVGGTTEFPVKFRLVAAGKPSLKEMIRDESFTGDLYYRIKQLLIEVPSLRERPEDIRPLVTHFKSVFEHDQNRLIEFTESTFRAFQDYEWPGNVRELENIVKELIVTVTGSVARPEDLPAEFRKAKDPLYKNGKLMPLNLLIAEQEKKQRELVIIALRETGNNVSRSAELLHIARSTLRDLMKRFQISESNETDEKIKSTSTRMKRR